MALVWCDGFEGYGDTDSAAPAPTGVLADKYLYVNDESRFLIRNTDTPSGAGWFLRLSNAIYNMVLTTKDVISDGVGIAGVSLYQQDWSDYASNFSWPIIVFKNSSAVVCVELICAQGCFHLFDASGNYVAGIRTALRDQVWNYIEMKAESGTTANVEVRINGATVFSGTVNTAPGTGDISRCGLGDLGQAYPMDFCRVDSFYVCDGSGNTNNDFLGEVDVVTLWPASDAVKEWTATGNANYSNHYQQVYRERRDGSTDYIMEDTSGKKDLFTTDNISDGTGTVHGVFVWAAMWYDTLNTGAKLLCKVGANTADSGNIATTTAVLLNGYAFETVPGTSNSWNQSTVNSMSIGVQVP